MRVAVDSFGFWAWLGLAIPAAFFGVWVASMVVPEVVRVVVPVVVDEVMRSL